MRLDPLYGPHFPAKLGGFLGSVTLCVTLLLRGTSVLIPQFTFGLCNLPMNSNAVVFTVLFLFVCLIILYL